MAEIKRIGEGIKEPIQEQGRLPWCANAWALLGNNGSWMRNVLIEAAPKKPPQ